jgi:uncharacterized membrane protein YbhN (UPF0104 family)
MIRISAKISFVLKAVLLVLLLGFVFRSIDFAQVRTTIDQLPWWYFALVVLYRIVLLLVVALRWWIVSPEARFKRLLRVTFSSQHLILLVPSGVTADAVRIWSVRSDPSGIAGNIGAIVTDKIVGLAALLLCFGLSGLMADLPPDLGPLLQMPALLSLSGGVTVFGVLYVNAGQRVHNYVLGSKLGKIIASKLPASIVDLSSRALLAGSDISRLRLIVNVCTAILYQLLIIYGYWLMSQVFSFQLSIGQMLFISSLVQIVMLFPVSIAGIGLKDVSLVYTLGLFGVEDSVALSASLSEYPVSIAFAVFSWTLSSMSLHKRENSLGL